MKKLYLIIPLAVLLFTACTKRDYIPVEVNPHEWMRTHDRGIVALVDYSTGNYIVDTYNGFAVVENWDGYAPSEYDEQYAYFDSRGIQTIYNYSMDYFSKGRIVENWLSWSDAMYILDDLRYTKY